MPRLLVFLALGAVWLDVAVAGWWPLFLYPVWIWVGIVLTVFAKKMAWRWLWLLAFGAWNLFIVSWPSVLLQLVIFGFGAEIFNHLFHRFVPAGRLWPSLVLAAVVLAPCQMLAMLATEQSWTWAILGRILITVFVIWFYEILQKNRRVSQYL